MWDLVCVLMYCTDALFQSARTRARLSMTYFVGVYSTILVTIQLAREESTRTGPGVAVCVRPFRS